MNNSLISNSTDQSILLNVERMIAQDTDGQIVKNSDLELTDKVYTFLAPNDIEVRDHYLEKEYMYFIYIELVTSHNVSVMKITIIDPDDKQYSIFESEMLYGPKF